MPFWEVIYETGNMSVISVDDEKAAKAGLAEQHRRARDGEVGGPTGHPAERIKRVLVYDTHPGEDQTGLHKDEALARAKELINALADENGVVDARAVADAFVPVPLDGSAGPHDSKHFAKETDELTLDFLPSDNHPKG